MFEDPFCRTTLVVGCSVAEFLEDPDTINRVSRRWIDNFLRKCVRLNILSSSRELPVTVMVLNFFLSSSSCYHLLPICYRESITYFNTMYVYIFTLFVLFITCCYSEPDIKFSLDASQMFIVYESKHFGHTFAESSDNALRCRRSS